MKAMPEEHASMNTPGAHRTAVIFFLVLVGMLEAIVAVGATV